MKNNRNNSAIQKPQNRVAAAIVDIAMRGELSGVLKIRYSWKWIENATPDDISKYLKVCGRYGKGTGWMQSEEGIAVGANLFYVGLRRSSLYKNASEKEKKVMLGETMTQWSRLKKAKTHDVQKYVQDQGRYNKGVGWMVSDEGKNEGALAFYARLNESPVYKWASYKEKKMMLGKVQNEVSE